MENTNFLHQQVLLQFFPSFLISSPTREIYRWTSSDRFSVSMQGHSFLSFTQLVEKSTNPHGHVFTKCQLSVHCSNFQPQACYVLCGGNLLRTHICFCPWDDHFRACRRQRVRTFSFTLSLTRDETVCWNGNSFLLIA